MVIGQAQSKQTIFTYYTRTHTHTYFEHYFSTWKIQYPLNGVSTFFSFLSTMLRIPSKGSKAMFFEVKVQTATFQNDFSARNSVNVLRLFFYSHTVNENA